MKEIILSLFKIIILLLCIIILGTLGYMFIEKWYFFDSIYMAVITLATVGYGEVIPLSPTGRIYTIFLIILGVGSFMYIAGLLVNIIVTNKLKDILEKRKMQNKIKKLEGHYIICGYGRIGTIIVKYLKEITDKIVIIENSSEVVSKIIKEEKIFALLGNAVDLEILSSAGIKKAKCLIATLSQDADNVFLTLTAKQLNPNLTIMSRANYKNSMPQLMAAGASVVESPYDLGAKQMALLFFKPAVRNFYDAIFSADKKDNDFALNEIKVSEKSSLLNKSIANLKIKKEYNIIVVYIIKENGETTFNPSSSTLIEKNDLLVVIGSYNEYIKLKSVLQAEDINETKKNEIINEIKKNEKDI